MIYFIISLAVLSIISTTSAMACPVTCSNRNMPPEICTFNCVAKCDCISGYLRNDNGTCVPECECDCKENEIYNECASACPVTCSNRNMPPRMCTLNCVAKCECMSGYLRNDNGTCVPECECDVDCGEHGYYSNCINPCPEGAVCAVPCLDGCLCEDGYSNVGRYGKCEEDSCE